MQFWWLKDRIEQKQFRAEWGPGKENLADYTTKFHIPAHHKNMRPIQLYIKDKSPSTLKGCVKIMNPVSQPSEQPRAPIARAAFIHRIYMTKKQVSRKLLTTPRLLTSIFG